MENNIITLIEVPKINKGGRKAVRKVLTEKHAIRIWRRKILTEKTLPRTTCLYFHINVEKQEPFYVGIGTNERPYDVYQRNNFWNNTTNKYDYIVVVLFVNLTWEQACELEIYWIAKIGRRDLEEGTLVNLTDGGDGNNGYIVTDEDRKRNSDSHMGNHHKPLIDLTGRVFGKLTVIKRIENKKTATVWACECECGTKNFGVRGNALSMGNTKSCGCFHLDPKNSATNKPVLQIERKTGKILSAFNSVATAAVLTNILVKSIYNFIEGRRKNGGGYNWKEISKEEYIEYKEFHDISTYKNIPFVQAIKIMAIFPNGDTKKFQSIAKTAKELKDFKLYSSLISTLLKSGEVHKETGIKFKKG